MHKGGFNSKYHIWPFHEQFKVFHSCVKFFNSKYVEITNCQEFGTHSNAPKVSYNENSMFSSDYYNLFHNSKYHFTVFNKIISPDLLNFLKKIPEDFALLQEQKIDSTLS